MPNLVKVKSFWKFFSYLISIGNLILYKKGPVVKLRKVFLELIVTEITSIKFPTEKFFFLENIFFLTKKNIFGINNENSKKKRIFGPPYYT